MNNFGDIKTLAINTVMLMITFSHLDIILKTVLVIVTLGYTIDKWVSHRADRRDKKLKKDNDNDT